MNEYDQTFNPTIHIGHYDLISWFSDFVLYLGTQLVCEQISFTLCLRMTRPLILLKVVLGRYDLISWFSDFPLYLGTQSVYEHTAFTICLRMTIPLTVKYSWVTVT